MNNGNDVNFLTVTICIVMGIPSALLFLSPLFPIIKEVIFSSKEKERGHEDTNTNSVILKRRKEA